VHANPVILTQLLRNELKFEGVAVTDWEDVMKLHQIHRVSGSMKESVQMAVDAGIDMCMVPNDFEFAKYLIELVKEGSIKEERLNISVRRILQMKQKLGLFSDAFTPAKNTYALFGSVSHQEAALNAAQESITLLKNEQAILPLKKSQKILVTGPAAQSKTLLNGAWTRTWQGVDEKYDEERQTTVVAAMRQYAGEQVLYAEGCSIDQITDAEWALKQAALADVIVVCLSEKPSTEKPGDITSLRLDAAQRDYVKMLHKTGKPLVLVLIENRPRIIEDIAGLAQGIVMGYLPGDQGAKALTQILYGEVNPSGKLPFTYPRDEQSLILYDHKYTEELDVQFQFNAFQPQWPFGYGLSYSPIVYSNLRVSTSEFGANQSVTVSVTVSNQSSRVAKESVLLFSRDHVASITPSVRRLRDFTKITLQPNESKTVQFEINASDLQFIGKNLMPTIEPGAFDLMIQNLVTTINYKP
jgi:beta-glucosidase